MILIGGGVLDIILVMDGEEKEEQEMVNGVALQQ